MRAGKKDRRIILQKPTRTELGNGETEETFEDLDPTWAEMIQIRAKELVVAGNTVESQQYAISIRWRPGITAGHRIKYEGRTLEISQVLEIGRRHEIQIVAHEQQEG